MTKSKRRVRLNADVGEDPRLLVEQDALIALLDEANIACGGHAGDADSMTTTVRQCRAHGVSIGAHPSYPDREGFGRVSIAMPAAALAASLRDQIVALVAIAKQEGARVTHVKPHGALYHDISDSRDRARAFAAICAAYAPGAIVVLRAMSSGAAALRALGLPCAREGFADRGARADGSLLPRGTPGALLDEPAAAQRARELIDGRSCDTLCVHADTPNALAIARAVRTVLDA